MAKKKSPLLSYRKIIFALTAVGILGGLLWWWYKITLPDFIRYDAFGIEIPADFTIYGIDVSKYQDRINWEAVKDMEVADVGVNFAFIKATEGLGNTDAYFKRNWEKAADAGLHRGAYHFFLAPKSGIEQAENFIRRVELVRGDLPPVLDVEQTYGVSPDKLKTEVQLFLDRIETHYGVKPIIYTNVEFYNRYLKGQFDAYPLWVAHYLQKDRPRIKRNWAFWQFSETGTVNGIRSKVDFNVFNGDSTDFLDLLME